MARTRREEELRVVPRPQSATEQGPRPYNHKEINSANEHVSSKDNREPPRRMQSGQYFDFSVMKP